MYRSKTALAALLFAFAPAAACGGSNASGGGAKSGVEGTSAAPGEATGDAPEQQQTDPREAACADGTCTPCGAGICPAGFYCDEKAPDGAGCSWLPECPSKVSCACVTGVLGSGCRCEERGGGTFVSCD